MSTMRIAVAQLELPADDDGLRRDRVVGAVESVAGRADLVVLPELATCGYLLDADHLGSHAEPADASGPELSAWRVAARSAGAAVLGGFCERSEDGRLFNSAVLVDAEGTVRLHYRKLHLFAAEHEVFVPGDRGLPVARLGEVAVGCLICYDLRFPEAWRILAGQGADLVAAPTAWIAGFDRADRDPSRPIAHVEGVMVLANLTQVAVACADQVGVTGPTRFLGRSLVVDAWGEPMVGPLAPDRADVAVATVDVAEVRSSRERGPGISPRANRRTDVYDDLLGYRRDEL